MDKEKLITALNDEQWKASDAMREAKRGSSYTEEFWRGYHAALGWAKGQVSKA